MLVIHSAYALAEYEPPQEVIVDTGVSKEEAQSLLERGQHDRAQLMIDNIFREAAEEYQKRTQQHQPKREVHSEWMSELTT